MAWIKHFVTSTSGYEARAVDIDADGNAYTGGNILPAQPYDNFDNTAFMRKYSTGGKLLWARRLEDRYRVLGGLSVDKKRNLLYAVGGTSRAIIPAGQAFISKYDAAGKRLWIKTFGSSAYDFAQDAAVGPGGAIFVVGLAYSNLPDVNRAVGGPFIRKYSASGQVIWTRQTNDLWANNVAVGGDGSVYVFGTDGDLKLFIRKYNPKGKVVWVRRFGRDSYNWATGMAIDTRGDLALSGQTGARSVVAKYNPDGTRLWTRFTSFQNGGLAVDAERNIYLVGQTYIFEAFLLKLDPSGRRMWTRTFASGQAKAAVADAAANVYVVGRRSTASQNNAFLAKFAK